MIFLSKKLDGTENLFQFEINPAFEVYPESFSGFSFSPRSNTE
jgi:hypothetical protein